MARYSAGVVVLTLFLLQLVEGQRVGVVKFNTGGISGYIKFAEVGQDVRIEATLQGLGETNDWRVNELPVDQTVDPDVQCLSTYVGDDYDPLNRNSDAGYSARCDSDAAECGAGDLSGKFGPLTPALNVTDSTGSVFLRGQYSIIGRSIVIIDGPSAWCGTIRSMAELGGAEVTLLQSSFVDPVGGSIYFRQVEGEDVQIWGKLFWTNDSPTTLNHNWHIHSLAPGEEYRMAYCNTSDNILGHYRPLGNGPSSMDNYSSMCSPILTQGCEVGDLTGKHDTLTVQATPSPYSTDAFFYTDNFLNLTGVNPVLNRSVAIHEANRGGPVIACAPLIRSENIVLTQYKVRDITMSQRGPFEDTFVTSINTRTDTTLQGFAFNQLVQNCVASPESVFSPYDPVPGVTTPDRYKLGALQVRYSPIGSTATQRLFNVPIYGADTSITSLNIRAVTGADSSTCSGLMPPLTGAGVVLAKVSFSRVVRGAVYMIQEDFGFGQLGNTHIIVDVYYEDGSTPATTGHNWHVHVNPSPAADTACAPTVGGHYNPFDVSLATTTSDPPAQNSDYSSDCTPRYQFRCESGDLARKHGRLNISPDGPNRPTSTYVDSNLQLSGSSTILGRSIALHDITEGAPIFDCGAIERVYISEAFTFRTDSSNMLRAALTSMLADQIDGVDNTDIIILNQEVSDVGFGVTCVDVSVHVLASSTPMANAYATMLNERAQNLFICNGSPRSASVRLATLILPLMMAILYLCGI